MIRVAHPSLIRHSLVGASLVVGVVAAPALADMEVLACGGAPEPTNMISIDLGYGPPAMLRAYGYTDAEGKTVCQAMIEIPLSSSPAASLRVRPADVARSMHDLVKQIGATECELMVFYENDVGERVAEHELCVEQTFSFTQRRVRALSDESFCWTPSEEQDEAIARVD